MQLNLIILHTLTSSMLPYDPRVFMVNDSDSFHVQLKPVGVNIKLY